MIEITNLSQERYYINPDLIETIEITPDTLITLINGKSYYAQETPEEVIARIKAYKRELMDRAGNPTVSKSIVD
ncbi:MAG TPA: flagellar FlbD family protein [Clostridiales bacterium]|jgi:flagellar protein FlbD|nr:flagellar FlbD family protein [Clostridiales bacterium]